VAKVFDLLDLGTLDHIDMVERVDTNGKKFQRIFVHFTAWSSNPEASAVRTRLIEGKEVKIVYDDPWFWKISVNKAKPAGTKAGGGAGKQERPRKKHVRPTVSFGGDDSLQERKQEKRAEQSEAMMVTTPTTTPPGSPRNKEVEVDEVREEEGREIEGVFESDSPDTEGEAGIQLSYPEELLLKKPAKRVRKIKKVEEKKKEEGEV
jgi:hypothetical protein